MLEPQTTADVHMEGKVHLRCADRAIFHHHLATTTNSYFSTSTLPYKQKAPQALTKSPKLDLSFCIDCIHQDKDLFLIDRRRGLEVLEDLIESHFLYLLRVDLLEDF